MGDTATNILELEITDLSRGGSGVARFDGQVIFVPLTVTGDRVQAEVVETKKKYLKARLIQVLRPSPERREPKCPAFGRCGGCEWQHVSYDLQWQTKYRGVAHTLKRVGIEVKHIDALPAERIWEYRNRIQLRGEGRALGYLMRGSKTLVPVDRCDIARPELNASWEKLRAGGEKCKGPFKVEVEISPNGQVKEHWNSSHAAGGFHQVHDEQNQKMQQWISDHIESGQVLYDLFGGAGNLSLLLAPRMKAVHCVDLSSPVEAPAPANFHFHRSSVLRWLLSQGAKKSTAPATAILDPPREGLGDDCNEIAAAHR